MHHYNISLLGITEAISTGAGKRVLTKGDTTLCRGREDNQHQQELNDNAQFQQGHGASRETIVGYRRSKKEQWISRSTWDKIGQRKEITKRLFTTK